MNTHSADYYALTDVLGIKTSQELDGFLNEFMNKYNRLDLSGFTLAPMQPNFTFEQIIKDTQMNVMASYVALQSDPLPIGGAGFSVATGSIPRQKMIETMDEIKMREMYMLQNRRDVSANRAKMAAAEDLFITLDKLFGGHTNSMTYQRNQIVSTGGFTTDATNNPLGIKGYKYTAPIPESNHVKLTTTKRWWTDKGTYKTEGTACDPIADLQAMVEKAENMGIVGFHFEIDKVYAKLILKHSKIVSAIAVNQFPLAADAAVAAGNIVNLSWQRRLEILGEIVGAPFKVIDGISSVQKYDGGSKALKNTQIRSFASDVIVLVPDGPLGQVLSVEPLRLAGGIYASRMGGRLLLNVSFDYQKKIQTFETELTALCTLDKPQYMFYLHPSGE